MAGTSTQERDDGLVLNVRLLGRFQVTAGDLSTDHWPRPSARRLCQLLFVSPGRRVSRQTACEALFPSLGLEAAARALYKAQSMARQALGRLGPEARNLLRADPAQMWVAIDVVVAVDLDAHEQALRAALTATPSLERDHSLVQALGVGGTPLEEEPDAEWAARVRERIESLRQDARLELARDRLRGAGRTHPEEVLHAWKDCFDADPSDEEAASALMRLYMAQGRRSLVIEVYERCRSALSGLGLTTSPALEELRTAADGSTQPPLRTSGADRRAAPQEEERRLVTVLFVELVHAGMGVHADPEDLRDVIGAGLAQAISEVEALGGAVASISGPIMSALFGVPQAHEDDPERALRSALRLVAAVDRVPEDNGHRLAFPARGRAAGPMLSVRVGVETGAAISRPMGSGGQMSYSAVGAVVGTAATLQSAARRGSVLVGPATYAATEGIFEWGPNQDVVVSHGDERLTATYLVQPRPRPVAEVGRRRLAAKATLVGRHAEVALLSEAVRATVSGRGGAVIVAGEPGLGKTRLVGEGRSYFMGWVGAASGRLPLWLEGRCASYASSTPYGAYQQLLSRFIGAPLEAGEAAVRPALEAAMRAVLGKDKEPVSLLARMLGLPPRPDEAHVARMAPAEVQHQTFSAVRSVLTNVLSRGPTVLALEDLHWSDPTSLRLTADLATLCASGPLLVLLTRRPEPDPGVGELETELAADPGRPLRVLQLAPIHKSEERALARSLLGGDAGDEVLDVACAGVDGNPLFLEERVASLLDTGALKRESSGWRATSDKTITVPEALERLIRSRTDRLSPAAQEAIVAASVLGDEADPTAIGAVSELNSALDGAICELVAAGLITQVDGRPEPLYRFRHAVIREAAYHGLLRSQRRQLHARAAWHIEANATNRLAEVAAVLGRHFAAADEYDRAAHYFELAGDRADQIFASEEAIALYRQALTVIGVKPSDSQTAGTAVTAERSVTACRLCDKLADILMLIDRFDEARTAALTGLAIVRPEETFQAARLYFVLGRVEFQVGRYDAGMAAHTAVEELMGPTGPDDNRERVELWIGMQLWDKYDLYAQRGELDRCAALVEATRPVAESIPTGPAVALFYNALALLHLRERRHRVDGQIVAEFRQAVEAAWAPEPPALSYSRPERIRISLMAYFGIALTWHGELDEARRVYEQALMSAEREGSPGARGAVLVETAITEFRRGNVEAVRELLPEAQAAAATRGDSYHTVAAKGLEAWVAWRDGKMEEALALGAEALDRWRPYGGFRPYCFGMFPLAGAHLATRKIDQAIATGRQLLDPKYAALPDELEAAVQASCDAWDRAEPERAGQLLADAIQLAQDLGYA